MSHTVGATTTSYEWDVARGLPVVLQDGTNSYVYGLDLISATDGSGNQTYYTYDGLGSTTDLTDGSAVVTDTYTYDVFGAATHVGGSANVWQFTGEQEDSSEGLYYLRARYYDPEIGRFVGQDTLPFINRYTYVGNNPTNYVDPSGLFLHKTDLTPDWVDNAVEAVAGAAGAVAGGAFNVVCDPYVAAIGCVAIGEAGNSVANSYFDLNFTGGCANFVYSGGVQFSFGQGFHPYSGGGVATGGTTCLATGSLTVAPYQGISPGLNCGVQGSVLIPTPAGVGVGPTGQIGVVENKEGNVNLWPPDFGEIGIAVGLPTGPGAAYTCVDIW